MTDNLASLAKERLALEQALKELDQKEARLRQKQEAEDWDESLTLGAILDRAQKAGATLQSILQYATAEKEDAEKEADHHRGHSSDCDYFEGKAFAYWDIINQINNKSHEV